VGGNVLRCAGRIEEVTDRGGPMGIFYQITLDPTPRTEMAL